MLGVGTLCLIFLTSLLWVCLWVRSWPFAHSPASFPPKVTKIDAFKGLIDSAPFFAWIEDKNGLMWVNKHTEKSKNEIKKLGSAAFSFSGLNTRKDKGRVGHITLENNTSSAFHVFDHTMEGGKHFYAFPKEEDTPPDQFIQTMSVTFAHLQIGIAAFDHQNELSLFNPALSVHLGLRPEWLLQKPNLLRFLDRLRNTNILPEPKDYTSWRKTFLKIERCAMKDDYRQDWELPDGRSLRVIGRPHPSGSVVFLIEDVTAPLAMERSFRSQVANFQNTLDATSVGLIVFDRKGGVKYVNEPMKQALPHHDNLQTIQDFSRIVQEHFQPTPIWGDLRQFIEETTDRSPWQADAETVSQERVFIRFEPIPTGDTLCEFHFPMKINHTDTDGLACAVQ